MTVYYDLYALRSVIITGMADVLTKIDVTGTMLTRQAIVQLFECLKDRTGLSAGRVTISGTVGAKELTEEDRLIATNKNWNITA